MDKDDNPYEILGVTAGATEDEIKKAYRMLARTHHPDKQKTDEQREAASAIFTRIADAYDLLQDPVRRYDWRMKNESSQPRSVSTSTSTSTSTATATRSATQSTTSRATRSPVKSHTPATLQPRASARSSARPQTSASSVRSHNPPPATSTMPPVPRRTPRSAAASAASPVGSRADSAGPRGRRVSAAIPRRAMAGTSPARAKSPARPQPGRTQNIDSSSRGGSRTRQPIKRPSMESMDDRSVQSSMSSRRVPRQPKSGRSLDCNSDHGGGRRVPRRTPRSDDASVNSRTRRPSSKESVNSMTRMKPSRSSVSMGTSMKNSRSEPVLRKTPVSSSRASLFGGLGGMSLRGSTADSGMRNATFESSSSSKSKTSRRR
ncbi:unnamed protein product [Cylindrotheca closterium]|uniref:J domain-containing protein n=1 Tax=Cylindrotheca closterium TaxID=2856 RepID=A0AAD2FWZ0_9STRA|nr:unnamed protein product [Cylindrotheca closterium]